MRRDEKIYRYETIKYNRLRRQKSFRDRKIDGAKREEAATRISILIEN